jgi:hypothetical protein
MDMDFVVHNTTTGEIIRHGRCAAADVSLQVQGPNETVSPVTYQPGSVVNGVLVPLSAEDAESQKRAERKAHFAELIAEKKRWSKA